MGRHITQSSSARQQLSIARRALVVALALAAIGTLVALVLLWPSSAAPEPAAGFRESQTSAAESVGGEVVSRTFGPCAHPQVGRVFSGAPQEAPPAPPLPSGIPQASEEMPQECMLAVVDITSRPGSGYRTLLATSANPVKSIWKLAIRFAWRSTAMRHRLPRGTLPRRLRCHRLSNRCHRPSCPPPSRARRHLSRPSRLYQHRSWSTGGARAASRDAGGADCVDKREYLYLPRPRARGLAVALAGSGDCPDCAGGTHSWPAEPGGAGLDPDWRCLFSSFPRCCAAAIR